MSITSSNTSEMELEFDDSIIYAPTASSRAISLSFPPVGLQNLGATCYINSVLQVFMSPPGGAAVAGGFMFFLMAD